MPMVTSCEFVGCSTLTVGRFCLLHDERPAERYQRGRPYPAAPRVRVEPARGISATVSNGEPLFYLWIRVCEGFSVMGSSGRMGVVDGVERGTLNEVTGVRVRHGLFRPSLETVLLEQVRSIAPVGRSVVVEDEVAVPASAERDPAFAAV